VEERGGLRLRQAQEAEFGITRRGSWRSPERASVLNRHHVQGRKRFEGEHPLKHWTGTLVREFPSVSYAPSEYQTKLWPTEALIERWFPLSWRGQRGFTVLSTVDQHSRFATPRALGAWRCSLSAPPRLSQQSDLRTGGDAGCHNKDIARRTEIVFLDIPLTPSSRPW